MRESLKFKRLAAAARRPHPLLRRLDYAAGAMVPFLLLAAGGLVIVDASCYFALALRHVHVTRISTGEMALPPPIVTEPR